MQLSVIGKQLDVGDALCRHAGSHLAASVAKSVEGAGAGNIVSSRNAFLIAAATAVHTGHGISVQGRGEAVAAFPAFAMALDHTAKQLQRQTRRLRGRHRVNTLPKQD